MSSLRGRLRRALLGGAGLLVLAGAFGLDRALERRLRSELDAALLAKARALATLLFQRGSSLELEFDDAVMPEFEAKVAPEYFQVWYADGRVLERSRSLAGSDLRRGDGAAGGRSFDLALPDGRAGRAVELRVLARDAARELGERGAELAGAADRAAATPAQAAYVVVARERAGLDRFLALLRAGLAVFAAALLGALAVLINAVLRRQLAPLEALAAQLGALDADSLGPPLRPARLPAELEPVVARLDALLERLRSALEREREFSVRLAHELRTPLAELRMGIDVALREPDDAAQLARALGEAHEIGLQMERLVANLLALARADAGLIDLEPRAVALHAALERAWRASARTAAARGLAWRNEVPPELAVRTGGEALDLAFANLLANAAAYADRGSWVAAAWDAAGAALVLRNPCTELDETDFEHVFERFWRRDSARGGGEHAGLGLTLVRSLARRLGLGCAVAPGTAGVFELRLDGFEIAAADATAEAGV